MTKDKTEALESLNETTEFDDWESYYDDDYELELDGDCNESQPCRGDEPGGDYYDDLYAGPPPVADRGVPAAVVVSSEKQCAQLPPISLSMARTT